MQSNKISRVGFDLSASFFLASLLLATCAEPIADECCLVVLAIAARGPTYILDSLQAVEDGDAGAV